MKKRIIVAMSLLFSFGYIGLTQAQLSIETICTNRCDNVWCDETQQDWSCGSDEHNKCLSDCKTDYDNCINQWDSVGTCICIADWWIKLNTNFPFVGRCIAKTSDGNTVTAIAGVFSRILMTIIITVGFGMLIRWGVQFAMNKPKEGKAAIMNVIRAFAALGSLGILLRLINPNFFR